MIVRDQSKNYFHLTPKIGSLWGVGQRQNQIANFISYFPSNFEYSICLIPGEKSDSRGMKESEGDLFKY